MPKWTVDDADDTYLVSRWGAPYFGVNKEGNLYAAPNGKAKSAIDLSSLVDDLRSRGVSLPVLLRFQDILGHRIGEVTGAFKDAIKEYEYKGDYRPVVPIKVNQQMHVVQELIEQGAKQHLGLEAGSKPELLAAIGMIEDPESTIICNGYKDHEYLETALLSCKLGLKTIIICDRFQELRDLVAIKKERGLTGPIGIRAKLSSRGAGRWADSGGETSKFGLSVRELVQAVELLRENDMLESLTCLHFHIGSQITAIRAVTAAVKEASRIFVDLVGMGATALDHIDIGGGLAVDYDGSRTNFHTSMNYTLSEYAANVVAEICDACNAKGVPHPTILSESGRAMVAHHSVLIFDVLGTNRVSADPSIADQIGDDAHELLREMRDALKDMNAKNFREAMHDATYLKDQVLNLHTLGYVTLKDRALADELYWAIASRAVKLSKDIEHVPDDIERVRKMMVDTYYSNFSVFQSVPDHWAVGSLFPVVPIQRLNERPTRQGIIADLTCDSDGKIAKFISVKDVRNSLSLHEIKAGESYCIGVFMVGAYQETLGDLHNLFGDTNVVHISLDGPDSYQIHHHVSGDSVADVLGYMEYDVKELIRRVRMSTEKALKARRMTFEEVRTLMQRYETGLTGYTYLEGEDQMLTPRPNDR